MPATSSAPGSQPQSVANANTAARKRQILDAVRTARDIGQSATGVARSIRRGTEAVQTASLVASGASPAEVAASSTASAKVRRKARKAHRIRREAKAQRRSVKRLIKEDPPKAEKLVQRETSKVWRELKDKTGIRGKAPEVHIDKALSPDLNGYVTGEKKVNISSETARRILAPPSPLHRKGVRVYVHESAHVGQARAGMGSGPKQEPKREAYAERYAQVAMRKIGKRYKGAGTTRESVQLGRRLAKHREPKHKIVSGQFQPGQSAGGKAKQTDKDKDLIERLDREYAPGETIKPRHAALLAEAEGLPGKTYRQIAKGESAFQPAAESPDGGHGLWQMTPRVQSAETQAAWEAIAAKHPGGFHNPVANAEMAKYLAGDSSGVSNYYGTAYMRDPDAHVKGGPAKAAKKLGKPAPASAKQKPGKWAGSERAVLELIPKGVRAEGRGDKRTPAENSSVGGAADSDHLTTNAKAYAADIPPDPKVYASLRKKLGLPKAATGSDTVTRGGYRYQLIFGAQYDHGDHIHLGAEWIGAGVPSGTVLGGSVGSSGGVLTSAPTTTSSGTPSTQPVRKRTRGAERARRQRLKGKARAKRMEGRAKSRLLRELIARGPTTEEAPAPSLSTPARTKVTVEL